MLLPFYSSFTPSAIVFLLFQYTMRWYVVFRGRTPGIYRDWATCNEQVHGFSRSCYQSFRTEAEVVQAYNSYFGGQAVQAYNSYNAPPPRYGSEDLVQQDLQMAPPPPTTPLVNGPQQDAFQLTSKDVLIVLLVVIFFFYVHVFG
jgi:hypothetical protein